MNLESPNRDCPPLLHFLAHAGAAIVCFILVAISTLGGLFAVLGFPDDDPGGPLFFVVLLLGVVTFAAVLTVVSGVAVVLSDLSRRSHVSAGLPPLIFFLFATGPVFLLLLATPIPLAVAPIVGLGFTLVFLVHWAVMSKLRAVFSGR